MPLCTDSAAAIRLSDSLDAKKTKALMAPPAVKAPRENEQHTETVMV